MFMELRKHILEPPMQHGLILYIKSEWSLHGPFGLLKWNHKELPQLKYSLCIEKVNAFYVEDGAVVVNTATSWFESQLWYIMGFLQQMPYIPCPLPATYFLLYHLQTAYHWLYKSFWVFTRHHFLVRNQHFGTACVSQNCHWNIVA
jgi:hypothetical protein